MDEHPRGFLYHNTDVFLTKDRKANRLDHKDVSLHLTTSDPHTSILLTVPDDGKIHTIPLNLAPGEEHSLHVQLGNHVPRHLISSNASPAIATAGYKRRRRSGTFQASHSHSSSPEQLYLTVRYTPPTTQQDKKATRSIQQYHARTIRQIETAFENAKQARLVLEAAPDTTKTDLVAAALEIHLLTKELNRRRAIEELYFEQTTTTKWFVVQVGVPSRLVGVPGSPMVSLFSGDGIREVFLKSMDEVVTSRKSVPVVALLPDPIDGKFVAMTSLEGPGVSAPPVARCCGQRRPYGVACHAGKVYVTYNPITIRRGKKNLSVLDMESGIMDENWGVRNAGDLRNLAVHGSNVFVADAILNCIHVLDMKGNQERRLGTRGTGNGQFSGPCGLAIAGESLYVCDTWNHRVQVFGLDGTWVRSWGSEGAEKGQFKYPRGITVHGDEVYVADTKNHRVQVFGLDGTFRRTWGSEGTGDGKFDSPHDITAHGYLIYVSDTNNNRVQSFDVVDGEFVGSWGTEGSADGEFKNPKGICVDDKGRLWVCDFANERIQLFR